MKAVTKKRYIVNHRGWYVAKALGWPSRCPGFGGAAGDLLDPFSPFKRPRSSMVLVHVHQRQGAWAVHRRVDQAAKQLTETT
jgi:hypothetical protein